jgi:integrase
MAPTSSSTSRLPANVKAIRRAVRDASSDSSIREFRIDGVRGLVLLALPSGTATWYLHYDVALGRARKRRKLKIGRLDEISLADAIAVAEGQRPAIRGGADPAAGRRSARTEPTFAELVEERFAKGSPLRPSTERDYRHVLTHDVLTALGPLPAKSVTRDQVVDVINKVAARGSTRRADLARAVVRSIFGFGIDRGLVEGNPATGLRNRHDYRPREIVAGADQIRTLWEAIEGGQAPMAPTIGLIIRLALLTGLRRAELAATERDDLDLGTARPLLMIPSGRAKNRSLHRVPLSPQAAQLFREAIGLAGAGSFVFPGATEGAHVLPRSVSKAMERTRDQLGIADVTIHDLRRTVGTYMSQLGVPRDVRERILNHGGKRTGNITDSVYNRYEYDAEKRAALELWADALDAILGRRPPEIEGYPSRLAHLKGGTTVRVG